MLRSEQRFVVSHVGSLVRPPALIKFIEKARDNHSFELAHLMNAYLTRSMK